jgi:hypothetical protein
LDENRTLKLLRILTQADYSVSLPELREKTAMANTSLNRLLNQLMKEMYVQKIRHGEYTAGPALLNLGSNVLNNSISSLYRPLIEKLSEQTGLNGELYSLSPQGPIMLFWIQGRSEFRVRMYPGFRLQMEEHPAISFFLHRYPGNTCWNREPKKILNDGTPLNEWLDQVERDNFLFEKGHVRPELARCCAALPGGELVIGLSGLISEFNWEKEELKELVHKNINDFEEEKI